MPKTLTTAIDSLKPKAPLTQGLTSPVKLLGASGSLTLSGLYLLIIRLLGAIIPKIKNALLLPLGETAASSRLLKFEGPYSPMALNADGFKNTQSIFALHQEAKRKNRPFYLQKQAEPRDGIEPRGNVPEAKTRT